MEFTNEYPALPADGPSSQAHIVNTEDYLSKCFIPFATDPKVQDALVTFLFKISANVLNDFLDMSKSFKLTQRFKSDHNPMEFVVWRQGDEVLLGQYIDLLQPYSRDMLEWDNKAKYKIGSDGGWTVLHMSYREYTPRDLREVWEGRVAEACHSWLTYVAVDKKMRHNTEQILAQYILVAGLWDAEVSEWTITTT